MLLITRHSLHSQSSLPSHFPLITPQSSPRTLAPLPNSPLDFFFTDIFLLYISRYLLSSPPSPRNFMVGVLYHFNDQLIEQFGRNSTEYICHSGICKIVVNICEGILFRKTTQIDQRLVFLFLWDLYFLCLLILAKLEFNLCSGVRMPMIIA